MEWRTIPDFDNYEVSESGTVRNRRTQQILKPYIDESKGGYPTVGLRGEGRSRSKTLTVHSLVMLAFEGPRPEGLQVRHLDGKPLNIHRSNLAYGTVGENRDDSVRHGTHVTARKTHCPQGHEYTGDNLIVTKLGRRQCRTCLRRQQREYARRKRAG